MTTVQDHSTSNATSFAQKGAVAALRGPKETLREWVLEFAARKDHIVSLLRRIPGSTSRAPGGVLRLRELLRALRAQRRRQADRRLRGAVGLPALRGAGGDRARCGLRLGRALRFSFALSRERIARGSSGWPRAREARLSRAASPGAARISGWTSPSPAALSSRASRRQRETLAGVVLVDRAADLADGLFGLVNEPNSVVSTATT